jgi:exoribonuclease R
VDIEDALSLDFLSNGIYEVGVHISDVTAYKNFINREEIQ